MTPKSVVAECFATFCLVLVSAGAVVVDVGYTDGAIGHVGACIAAGLVVTAMVYCVGDVSGAHFNPAVTIAFWAAGRMPFKWVPPYIIAQLLGSLAAAGTLLAVLGPHGHLGATMPHAKLPFAGAFIVEVVLTMMLMYVILCVATGAKEKGLMAGIAIGVCVMMNCLWAGPLTGAAMNPARTFGPSILSDASPTLWLYCTAPVIGAALAVIVCRLTHNPGQCCRKDEDEEAPTPTPD